MLKIIICLVLLGAGVISADENPCVEPGVNRAPSDNASFIICSEVGNSMDVTKVVHCPTGYIYSEENRTCVEEGKKPHHRVSRATSVLCKSIGPSCASCDLLVVCAEMNGKLVPLTNVSCSQTSSSSDNVCDAKTLACTPPTDNSNCHPATSNSYFQCIQPGFFPDPYDCKKYHICSDNLDHYEDSCDSQYDPVQATCIDKSTCTNLTREACSKDPRPAAISSNSSYYSVCIPTVARSPTGDVKLNYQIGVLECSENKYFNNTSSSCEFACKTRPDRFSDPTDCHSYYDCPNSQNATDPPMKKTCPQDLAYDSTKKMCALESKVSSCHTVTTREVTETTTSSVSTTTVASSTSTTAAPSTRTTAAPATRATTSSPSTTTRRVEECTENSTRQDNSSRYRYYQCQGGRFVQKQCPSFSRYNTLYNSCVYSLF